MDCWFIVSLLYLLFLFSGCLVCIFISVCIVYSHFFYAVNCVLFLSMVDGSVVLILILSKLRYAMICYAMPSGGMCDMA